MDDIRATIDPIKVKQSLADGSYYNNARRWYDELYHKPIAERSYFLLITGLSALTIFFSVLVYLSMQPLSRIVPYTIYTDDITEELPRITSLKFAPEEDLDLSIARFLVRDYVLNRESYNYDVTKLEWQFNRIRQTSGEAEFSNYQRLVNPENAGSPFNKYGREASRIASIYNLSFNLEANPRTATVYFTTLVKNGESQQQNNWIANLSFRFPDLTVDAESNEVYQWNDKENRYELAERIDFRVLDYAVQEITQRTR